MNKVRRDEKPGADALAPWNGGPCLLSVPTVKSNGGERRAWWGVAALTLFAFTGCAERGRVRTSSAAGSSAGSTLSRAVLPAECATAPVFGWLGADQLVKGLGHAPRDGGYAPKLVPGAGELHHGLLPGGRPVGAREAVVGQA